MLSLRQEKILEYVIKEYTRRAEPVGSVNLLKRYNLDISPATVRSELFKLEQGGYLYQPYTSSGRVPSDQGYRYFVSTLMRDRELSRKDQGLLQEELLKLKAKNIRLARTTAKLLAAFSRNLAISGLIDEEEYFQSGMKDLLTQPEFKQIDEICKIAGVLDYLDDNIDKLIKGLKEGDIKTLIGRENPLIKSEGCSVIVSRFKYSDGQSGVIAIMGPKRMQYDKNISLVKYVRQLLGGPSQKLLGLIFLIITLT
jgi:heat-inducible transcriptional repressor